MTDSQKPPVRFKKSAGNDASRFLTFGLFALVAGAIIAALDQGDGGAILIGGLVMVAGAVQIQIAIIAYGVRMGLRMYDDSKDSSQQ